MTRTDRRRFPAIAALAAAALLALAGAFALPATAQASTVTSVVVASAPQSGNTYYWGETIVFTVTFNEPVRVTGRPGLEVGLDNPAGSSGSTVQARFWGLSESQRPTPGTPPPAGPGQPARAFRLHGAAVRP